LDSPVLGHLLLRRWFQALGFFEAVAGWPWRVTQCAEMLLRGTAPVLRTPFDLNIVCVGLFLRQFG
jgi:hypothetical protein